MNIAVLGSGMVGRAIALDLAERHQVTSFDLHEAPLQVLRARNASIHTRVADLGQFNLYTDWLQPFDLVVTAVPGFMGYRALEAVIDAGKDVVDISFFPEDALQLHELAVKKNVTAITDCGVAPGMSNFIIGRYNEEIKVNAFEIYVGGLPKVRKKPFEYKAPFSPVDVIEEYTRPARLKENGHIVVKPALSERNYMNFEGIGTLEAFNTDGLRSLLHTMPHVPNQKEQTLRYPGHVDLILALQQSGFFGHEPVEVDGHSIRPIDFSSKILFKEWKLGPDEEEFTVMRVIVDGEKDGKPVRVTYDLLDRYDPVSGISSMSRTTGYTCTAAVELVAKGLFKAKGVFPPELVGKDKACFDFVLDYLRERKINWQKDLNG
ncbi:saccharopine dehydrogenase NADP-binding domain-containing protein [Flavihumibacter rivuli]|uniref:saccharopine dehydrogenase family protein n=1 Tax=Flavihumibacter rivuli TaxID=2838156 RepID=UPI001BDED015|nr:saccharopine dehydrogenase C-terminal domain-containing protein [Flavihumibacter rivuli]ULQ55605.1 saccharopine dehydrogenase NADP-binding domain-containing protein [Flavihumibacter rivuli]